MKLVPDEVVTGAVGDLVLIIPAGVLVAIVWGVTAWLKTRSSRS